MDKLKTPKEYIDWFNQNDGVTLSIMIEKVQIETLDFANNNVVDDSLRLQIFAALCIILAKDNHVKGEDICDVAKRQTDRVIDILKERKQEQA